MPPVGPSLAFASQLVPACTTLLGLALYEVVGWSVWPACDLHGGLISHGGEIVNNLQGCSPWRNDPNKWKQISTT